VEDESIQYSTYMSAGGSVKMCIVLRCAQNAYAKVRKVLHSPVSAKDLTCGAINGLRVWQSRCNTNTERSKENELLHR
jgi:hypothetical protein